MNQLHVVVGHPYSDIGKGWVASSIAASLGPETPIVKIDPMLSPGFPAELGIAMGDGFVTDDAATYMRRGLAFHPDRNIVLGGWLARALGQSALEQGVLGSEAPKITYADLAHRLAGMLSDRIGNGDAVIEIGGCPDDKEASLPADAIRLMMHDRDVRLHLLTAYDYTTRAERQFDVKTRMPVRAVEAALTAYRGVSLKNLAVYIRRANVPDEVGDQMLKDATNKVAFKSQLMPPQVTYIPNLGRPEELDEFIILSSSASVLV